MPAVHSKWEANASAEPSEAHGTAEVQHAPSSQPLPQRLSPVSPSVPLQCEPDLCNGTPNAVPGGVRLSLGREGEGVLSVYFFFEPKGAYGTPDEAFVVLTCACHL